MAERLTSALHGTGEVIAAESLEGLAHLTGRMAANPPTAIAIHGGDGTLHKSLTAIIRAFQDRPLPIIAILPGGTMNVVASSLHLDGRPEGIVAELAALLHAGRPVPTVDRRCLKVGDIYGFVFGNGLMANFLEEYYSADQLRPGPGAVAAGPDVLVGAGGGVLRRPGIPSLRRKGAGGRTRVALAPSDRGGRGDRAGGGPGVQAEPPG